MRMRRRSGGRAVGRSAPRWSLLVALAAAAVPAALPAQRFVNGGEALSAPPNPPYDGRFTYARIRFTQTCCVQGGQYWDVKWGHDYPRADRHFPRILQELTTMRVRSDVGAILTLDDPQLFKFPFAYLCEPGYWMPSDKEVAGLRQYLLRGGFLIVDDFVGNHWYNFETQMRRAFPEGRLIPVPPDHPIFDSFYRIPSLEFYHPYFSGVKAEFYGLFEDNDPKKRMMAVVNYNFDVSEFWEFSDEGLFPIDLSNEAYKLGVNYVIYSMSR